ncbi:nitrous oxide reductase accessory protein NosL [Rhodocyclaceae bacterium SMB388]
MPSVGRLVGLGAIFAIASLVAWWWPHAHGESPGVEALSDVCIVAPPTPYDPASGLDIFEPRPVPADARCPVCGMYPSRFPDWAGQVIFKDGAAQFFDSPVNLQLFLRNVSRYSPYQASDVAVSFVNDIASGQWTPASDAFYVHGSSALGPMREGNLPTFADRAVAERFAADRGGEVLTMDEITDEILGALVRDAPQHHQHH